MKKIILKTEQLNLKPFTGEEKVIPFSYKESIINSLRISMPEGGFSFGDIEIRMKIMEKIEKADDHVILEDKHFKYLVDLIKSEKWMFMDQVILNFIKQLEESEDV